MRTLSLALVALVALSGCAGGSMPGQSAHDAQQLASAKAKAGLPDCPETDASAQPKPGHLPALTLKCLGGGKDVNLAGLTLGPYIVNLWAQWCGPCRAESEYIAKASKALSGKVQFIGINYNDPRPELAIEFAGTVDWTFPHVVDEVKDLARPLSLRGIPVTLFLDASGKIVYRHIGAFTSTDQITKLAAQHFGV